MKLTAIAMLLLAATPSPSPVPSVRAGTNITVSGTTVSCTPASASSGGCLNRVGGAMVLDAGLKVVTTAPSNFTGPLTVGGQVDLQGNTVVRGQVFCLQPSGCIFVADDQGLPVSFTDSVPSASSTASFTQQTGNNRYAGPLAVWRNGVTESLRLDAQSNLLSGCAPNPDGGQSFCGSFVDNSAVSGHTTLTVSPGLYVSIVGQNAHRYWAEHGAVTMANANPMMAGYIWELEAVDVSGNGGYTEINGARSNKKLMVNYNGGLHWGGAYSLSQFGPCGNYENHPVNDGGSELLDGGDSYYTATDAGVSQNGTLNFAVDKQALYLCVVPGTNAATLPDGGLQTDGTWYALPGASTIPSLGQVTIGGGGTVTAAVQSGQRCQCTYDSTATAELICHVSSTTLTVTGTIGAIVNYRCET